MAHSWTQGQLDFVKDQVTAGIVASQIVQNLWRSFQISVTRNAVLGQIHRCGFEQYRPRTFNPRPGRTAVLMDMPVPVAKQGRAKRKERAFAYAAQPANVVSLAVKPVKKVLAKPISAKILLPAIIPPPQDGRISILKLNETTCHWPLGDPRDADFGYCGGPVHAKRYCCAHYKLAYEPRLTKAQIEAAKAKFKTKAGDLKLSRICA